MGIRSIKMPDVGEGVAEAEIVEWAVKVGDLVREDQVVAAVMTDKATVDIPTPVAGSVLALGGAVGDVLAVGAELIRIDAPGMPDLLLPAAPKSRPQQQEPPPADRQTGAVRRARRQPSRLRVHLSRRRRRRVRMSRKPARRAHLARSRSPRPHCV